METIEMAAIRYPETGLIFTMPMPAHHRDIKAAYTHKHKKFSEKGFITSEGRFVDRYEGYEIAINAGQYRGTKKAKSGELHSENVW